MTKNRHRKLTRAQTEEALKTVKIVDKKEAFWNGAVERAKTQIGHLKEELEIAELILEAAERRLKERGWEIRSIADDVIVDEKATKDETTLVDLSKAQTDDSHEHKE